MIDILAANFFADINHSNFNNSMISLDIIVMIEMGVCPDFNHFDYSK
jgi:hypothetical protein